MCWIFFRGNNPYCILAMVFLNVDCAQGDYDCRNICFGVFNTMSHGRNIGSPHQTYIFIIEVNMYPIVS